LAQGTFLSPARPLGGVPIAMPMTEDAQRCTHGTPTVVLAAAATAGAAAAAGASCFSLTQSPSAASPPAFQGCSGLRGCAGDRPAQTGWRAPGTNAAALAAATATAAAAGGAARRRRARIALLQGRSDSGPSGLGNSAAVPFLQVPKSLTNNPEDPEFPGDCGFDPLGFSSSNSPIREFEEYLAEVCQNSGVPTFDKLRWYREAELMHGRVCMLASMNIIIREFGQVVLPDSALTMGGKLQFLQVMTIFEAYRGYRLLFNADALAGDLGLGMGAGGALAPDMTREELAAKQFRELQNGRLAMIGFLAMMVQYAYTGNFVVQNSEVEQLKAAVDAVMLPENAALNTAFVAGGLLLAFDGIRRLNPSSAAPGTNSIAQQAINVFNVKTGMQDPQVSLPAGVVPGSLPQKLQLTEAQVQQFEEDGVLMIRGGMKDWVDFLSKTTEHQIANPHIWSLVGRMSGLYDYIQRNMWMTNDGFRDFLYYSPLGHIISQVARTPEVRVSTDMLLVNPNKGFGWHQDNQNGPIDFPDAVRWWVAMDKCGENDFGAPEYLLGSHRNSSVSGEAVFVDLSTGDLPNYQKTLKFVAEPGDLLIWDSRTIHRIVAPPGQSWAEGTQRRALGGTAAKAGAIYLNKGGASAISDLAGHSQQGGELLGGPYFPRIYPSRIEEEEAVRRQGEIVGRSPKKIADLGVKLASNAGKYISFTKVVGKKS